jgi:cation transport regulator ChaC
MPIQDEHLCWYFAYGSNMQRATFEGRRGMRPARSLWGTLAGYRLCFDLPVGSGERGVANLNADEAECVYGVLYLVTSAELERLDRTEGVESGYYRRVEVDVVDRDGNVVRAWTYLSPHAVVGRKPSPRYIGLLLEGAREHELPPDYVARLEAYELAHDERLG